MTSPPASHAQAVEILRRKRAAKDRPKTQKDIVRQHSELIEALIRDNDATLLEVGDVLRDLGEPVRQPGLDAAIRKQLGHTKDIRKRRGGPSQDAPTHADVPVTVEAKPFEDDDEDAFVARRPRGDSRQ